MSNKEDKLGIPWTTANQRLNKDLLFKYVSLSGEVCFRCGLSMSREEFSVDHKESWLMSDDPLGKFLDVENVAFSHLVCNIQAAERNKKDCPSLGAYRRGCRCDECKGLKRSEWRKRLQNTPYCSVKRRKRYEKYGS